MTFSARKYLRPCWREGWGGGVDALFGIYIFFDIGKGHYQDITTILMFFLSLGFFFFNLLNLYPVIRFLVSPLLRYSVFSKSSFFYVMRPRLKKQNHVKYSNRSRLVGQRSYNFTKSDKKGSRLVRKWWLETSADYRTVRELESKHLFERMNYYSKHSITC